MKVRIAFRASREEASAIAAAVAEHVGETVDVYVGDSDEPTLVRKVIETAETTPEDDLGPADRERTLREEIADIERGGPEKYRERLADHGKLFVRDRLDLWFDGLDFEDGRFANFDSWQGEDEETRLPADGLITGVATFEGRKLHVGANDFTVKAGSVAKRCVEKFLRLQQRALKSRRPALYLEMIYATAAATVPKQCVVVRKAYRAGIYAMSGPAYDPEERAKREQELREEYRDDIDAHRMASEVIIDEIVPPSDLRAELAARFELYDTVEKDRPEKKHGTIL